MCKKIFALLCALVFTMNLGWAVSAGADRPAPEVKEGEKYVSDYLPGASALYVSGEQITLDNAVFYGAGYASDQQITDQIPNQYGLAAVVLAAGEGSEITLNEPTIVSDPESYANGDYTYHCEVEGDFEWFHGKETIRYKGYVLTPNTYIEKTPAPPIDPKKVREEYMAVLKEVQESESTLITLLKEGGYIDG